MHRRKHKQFVEEGTGVKINGLDFYIMQEYKEKVVSGKNGYMANKSSDCGRLSSLFQKAGKWRVPLHERDRINIFAPMITSHKFSEGNDGRLINFQYILETGRLPCRPLFGSISLANGMSYIADVFLQRATRNQHIKWSSDDAFIRALTDIREKSAARIEDSLVLQALLQKDRWGKDDRVMWERNVSWITAEEVDRVPGLGEYRTISCIAGDKLPKKRPVRLNALSSDIEKDVTDIEFNCESMAAVEGVILQQMDNVFLPSESEEGDFKVISNYFYVVGGADFGSGIRGGHAFIQSSATGSIIEATNKDPSDHYFEVSDPHYGVENMKEGARAYTRDGVYGGYHIFSR